MTAVLSEEQRAQIRAEYQTGNVSQATLAARYGVGARTIFRVVQGIGRQTAWGRKGTRR